MPDSAVAAEPFIEKVRAVARRRILYLPHAVEQMNAPDELITAEEVRAAIFDGEIIEEYPEDVRGHSCLMLGLSLVNNRPVHIVCAPKEDYLAIITAYLPDPDKWSPDFRKRVTR
ncbi:MAG: DUF4258 domain-containing protein [Anaerolineales bacterium]|nr:DUF4258 domain-containing protein [Anaerolineales bacterium]